MAAKIGSETAATFWYSIINNTRTPLCTLNTSSTTSRRRTSKDLCIVAHHFARAPSPWAVRATSGPPGPNSNDPNFSSLQDDLEYLFKLTIGSVVGAALIKYGSAAVPNITRPDITQALLMISTPPFIAVLLLAKESRKD